MVRSLPEIKNYVKCLNKHLFRLASELEMSLREDSNVLWCRNSIYSHLCSQEHVEMICLRIALELLE